MNNIIWFSNTDDDYSKQIVNRDYDGKVRRLRSRAAEPIKDAEDVKRLRDYILYERPYRQDAMRKRDYLLVTLGVSVGLRAGDLRELKIGDVLDHEGKLRRELVLKEEKTGKQRTVYLCDAALEALRIYLNGKRLDLNDPLFGNMSHNNTERFFKTVAAKPKGEVTKYKNKKGTQDGISVNSISRILKQLTKEAGIDVHASSHMLRKTFGYRLAHNDPDFAHGIALAQEAYGHSSTRITNKYLGLTGEEMERAYRGLWDDHTEEHSKKEVKIV